jgi:hypothetical protein
MLRVSLSSWAESLDASVFSGFLLFYCLQISGGVFVSYVYATFGVSEL